MIKNYLVTAFRFLMKNKSFSAINIIGLAIGTLCCLYIVLYVEDQYSYDRHHQDAGSIYRITTTLSLTGDKHNDGSASPPIAPTMKQEFAEVKQFTRVIDIGVFGSTRHLLKYKDNTFYEKDAIFVDSTFFDVFTYHFTNGIAKGVLDEPYSMVLLKPTADKLFGNENPVGKTIQMDYEFGKHDFKVTGVVDQSLGKSHIHANLFITMNSGGFGDFVRVRANDSWAGNNFAGSYVKLNPNADAASLERKLPAFLNKHGAGQLKQLGMEKQLHLQPVTSIHTSTGYELESDKTVSPSFLRILLLIAFLIQLVACINFMNLSTARASKRAKEVGVRKVIGAGKADLIRQFLGESFLIALIGVILAMPLLWMSLPWLNDLTQANVQLSLLSNTRVWVLLTAIVVITGLVAGSYPAFYLSAFQAIKVIKGNFTNHVSATGIRRSLVVFQFVLSIVLIAGIIVIYSQLNYMKNKDLGFDKSQKLIFSFYTDDTRQKMPAFVDDLRQLAEVKVVGESNFYLSQFVVQDHGVYLNGGNMASAIDAQNINTDEYFAKANGIKVISGRDFHLYDSGKVLINETLVKRLGLTPDKAVGVRLYTQYAPNPVSWVEVAGVMKDFNFASLHSDVKPIMLVYDQDWHHLNRITASISSTDYTGLLHKIGTIWRKDLPSTPFEYTFLDQEVQKQYEAEMTLSNIINSFTLMAIFISCLGLFGLAAFSAEQRNKEIGIRKVLGASVPGLVRLLSKDFLQLVFIAMLIAIPIAWWSMNKWLEAFAYRVPISWWMFGLAGILAILIALLTVSFQAIRAAVANPVRSLRSE
ncbi:MAG: ABC transporter permease [Bacteroidota bacterium]|nr:ABC transporter permease [Bacteroidota bacterium]